MSRKRKHGNRVKYGFQKSICKNLNQICYPPFQSEFEVQAELAKQILCIGVTIAQ